MSLKVWKYDIDSSHIAEIAMPSQAVILSIQPQGDGLKLWALVNSDMPVLATRRFLVVGTGHAIEGFSPFDLMHRATCQFYGGSLVLHVFEIVGEIKV